MTSSQNFTFDAIRRRSAVRRFSTAEIPETLLVELMDLANRAPSGFNLQPWHFIIVRNRELRQLMKHVAMEQAQVAEAPAIVIFAADPEAWKNSYEAVLELARQTKTMTDDRIVRYRTLVRMYFKNGPLGLFGFAKRIFLPIRRMIRPTPTIVTSRQEAVHYVRSQTMLAAATFMIAAQSAGLETSPIEGFDEERLKKLLAIPKSMTIPIIIATGYRLDEALANPTARLPLEQKLSLDLFPNKAKLRPVK